MNIYGEELLKLRSRYHVEIFSRNTNELLAIKSAYIPEDNLLAYINFYVRNFVLNEGLNLTHESFEAVIKDKMTDRVHVIAFPKEQVRIIGPALPPDLLAITFL
jgi:hypothetical protein